MYGTMQVLINMILDQFNLEILKCKMPKMIDLNTEQLNKSHHIYSVIVLVIILVITKKANTVLMLSFFLIGNLHWITTEKDDLINKKKDVS